MLSDEERLKFAGYCDQQSLSAAEMLKAFEHSNMPPAIVDAMKKRERETQFAFAFVAKRLRDTESFSVSNPPHGE